MEKKELQQIRTRKDMFDPGKKGLFICAGALVVIAAIVFFFLEYDLSMLVDFFLDKDMNPALFILLMCALPIVGFPLSVFLVLAGAKFGITLGIVVTALIMPVHLISSFILSHFLVREQLRRLLEKMGYRLPRISGDRAAHYAMIFSAIPGPPYAVKNYFLSMSGVPFRTYLAVTWPVQLVICIPFVGLGGSAAGMNYTLSAIFAGMLVAVYFIVHWIKRRFEKTVL